MRDRSRLSTIPRPCFASGEDLGPIAGREAGDGERPHPGARVTIEAPLLAAGEQAQTEAHEHVAGGGRAREGVDVELHRAGVLPPPDLPGRSDRSRGGPRACGSSIPRRARAGRRPRAARRRTSPPARRPESAAAGDAAPAAWCGPRGARCRRRSCARSTGRRPCTGASGSGQPPSCPAGAAGRAARRAGPGGGRRRASPGRASERDRARDRSSGAGGAARPAGRAPARW